jgi:NADH:ubiquinone oxidoreductase subunit
LKKKYLKPSSWRNGIEKMKRINVENIQCQYQSRESQKAMSKRNSNLQLAWRPSQLMAAKAGNGSKMAAAAAKARKPGVMKAKSGWRKSAINGGVQWPA